MADVFDEAKVHQTIEMHTTAASHHERFAERLEQLAEDERREQYRLEAQAEACRAILPKPPVHNHGTEEGDGLACREQIIGGLLRGACMPDLESTASETEDAAMPELTVETEGLVLWRTQHEHNDFDCDGTYLLTPRYVLAHDEDDAWNKTGEQFDIFEGHKNIGVYSARPATDDEAAEWLASFTRATTGANE